MSNTLTKVGREFAFKQILLMIVVVFIITLTVYFFWGFLHAKSAFVGGFVAIVPNMIFAYKAFRYAGAQSSSKVMESFYSGVKFKMLYTALLFALALKFLVLIPAAFLTTYCVVVFLPLLLPVFLIKNN
ncbi:ATP synthase I [Colwellia sp. MT41]|uniref:ATP synthase protein I n=1 Tax=Colwellia marinimaniae TaxID=1513592 RepID=A0ABQ0MRC9_9GAMM|nr:MULTISPECIES: ATP synthase subunit I [Colwellia]ALO33306.1 ATP synthase I [Colwellia sp. MT41]GAW94919.1 ATP synthase protein I [Colwellia marinimaniae]